MGVDYQHHLIHAQAIPERRGTLALLAEAARTRTALKRRGRERFPPPCLERPHGIMALRLPRGPR